LEINHRHRRVRRGKEAGANLVIFRLAQPGERDGENPADFYFSKF
jgi:hypothetical protein